MEQLSQLAAFSKSTLLNMLQQQHHFCLLLPLSHLQVTLMTPFLSGTVPRALPLSRLMALLLLCFPFPAIVPLNATVYQTVVHLNLCLFYCQFVPVFLWGFVVFFFFNTYLSCSPSHSFFPHTNIHLLTTANIPSTFTPLLSNFPPLSL